MVEDDGRRAGLADNADKEGPGPVLRNLEAKGGQVPVDDGGAGSAELLFAEGPAKQPVVDGGTDARGQPLLSDPSGAVRSRGMGQAFGTSNAACAGLHGNRPHAAEPTVKSAKTSEKGEPSGLAQGAIGASDVIVSLRPDRRP